MPHPNIEELFDLNRCQSDQGLYFLVFYFPFGVVLLLFRVLLGFLVWPLITTLPKLSSIRSIVVKYFYMLLGFVIREDTANKNESIKLLICNHISIFDHLAVDLISPCKLPDSLDLPGIRLMGMDIQDKRNNESLVETVKRYIRDTEIPFLIFPELATTNGNKGLLTFVTWPFSLDFCVQPVVLKISRPTFIEVAPSLLNSQWWSDIIWFLFVPYTQFNLRYLSPLEKSERESIEEFTKRVQHTMAEQLDVFPTPFTAADKKEYSKRIGISLTQEYSAPAARPDVIASSNIDINEMARQIKAILPSVPLNIICQDLAVTRCVDATVSRILEGEIAYIPEQEPSSSSCASSATNLSNDMSPFLSSSSSSSISLGPSSSVTPSAECLQSSNDFSNELPSLCAAAKSFGKTPKERMMSYQERKAQLIDNARKRYMQKHNLI